MGEILLISADWQFRALVRAQLLEEGFQVRALPSLEDALATLMRGSEQPRVTILDLQGVEGEARAVSDLWRLTGEASGIISTSSGRIVLTVLGDPSQFHWRIPRMGGFCSTTMRFRMSSGTICRSRKVSSLFAEVFLSPEAE